MSVIAQSAGKTKGAVADEIYMFAPQPDSGSRYRAWLAFPRTRLARLPGFAKLALALVLVLVLQSLPSLAQTSSPPDLTQASLEDLLKMEVTSVSKREQPLSTAGAAVFVITQEDIRRSGATNIPDLLRMAPGVNVAQVNASTWAIGIRGFSDVFANKVLVLVDGRSVYNPMTSGVVWSAQDVPLEDIERIEVIRGPGGTVWGANAVNGVINIITRSAKDTKGWSVGAGGGSQTTAEGLVQYGGAIGTIGTYRVFGTYSDIQSSNLPGGGSAEDGWHSEHGGFRSDWDLSPHDTLTVQGDLQEGRQGQNITTLIASALPLEETFTQRFDTSAGNILGRWNHVLANGSETSLQIYDDNSHNASVGGLNWQNTVDLDFQDHLALGSRQDIVWGLGARVASLHMSATYAGVFRPPSRTDLLLSTFFQDRVKITNTLAFTFGSKLEHNDYTGFELEPSAQLVWNPTVRQALWLSAARAIREPDAVDVSIQSDAATFPTGPGSFGLVQVVSNPIARVERLTDFEVGHRIQAAERLSVDVAAFLSFYHDLRTVEQGEPYLATSPGPPQLIVPSILEDSGNAHTYGGEVSLNWNPTNRWRVSSEYSIIHMVVFKDAANVDPQPGDQAGSTPQQQFQVRSELNLPHRFEWDSSLGYVGRLAAGIPAYTRLDVRLGRKLGEHLDFSIAGQNLLSPRHLEFPGEIGLNSSLVPRTVFARIAWKFW
jgi:iron complex outermembrane recepter protein